jgi:hypothetical protein
LVVKGGNKMITMMMQPDVAPMTWEDFCDSKERFSVAIDGFVNTGPRYQDPKHGGPRSNFNHHEEVDRFSTRATCAQALIDIRTGFFDAFRKDGQPHCTVYANDCDQDVCTTWFLLKYGWMVQNVINPRLNKLVHMEDMLDTTGGAYPFPKDMPILQELAWIFQPYTAFRMGGGLNTRDPQLFMDVVESVEHRIMKYIHNEGGSIPLDTRYEIIGGGTGWTMVREIGAQARTGMLADGIKAFVSIRERADDRINVTIGRMSNKTPFNVEQHLQDCSAAEPNQLAKWGGGNTIGGSDRSLGTEQTIAELQQLIEQRISVAV